MSFSSFSFTPQLQGIEQDFLDLHTLTSYVSYARKNIHPKLSDEAAEELTRGYVELRRRGNFPGSSKKVRLFKYIPVRANLIVYLVPCLLYICFWFIIFETTTHVVVMGREGKRDVYFSVSDWNLLLC